MWKKIGHRYISFDAANEGGSGAAGGTGGAGDAHPITAPWAAAEGVWTLGEGEQAKPWYSTIPEEAARQHIEAKAYRNPAELALANYNLTRLQRGDPSVIGVPGENATPEDWNAFYGKLGRPETPEGYEFQFGDDVKTDPAMVEWGKKAFHDVGLTPKQAQALAEKWNQFAAEQTGAGNAAFTQQNDQELAALETKWGADLQKNKAAGQRVVQALGLSADLLDRVESHIGAAPLVELLALIGRKTDEGGFMNGNGGGDPNAPENMSKEQAASRIAQLQADAEFQKKYTDKNHPQNKEAVDLMVRLFARA